MSVLTPPARAIDPRGQRFGAGVSAAMLVAAIVSGSFWLAAIVGLNLLIAAAFGTRFFLPSRPWRAIRATLRLRPAEPEHEYPPRFAQALGGTCIALATAAYLAGIPPLAWLFVAAVAALQTLLASTGFCLGCRLYFLRWLVPSILARLFGRVDKLEGLRIEPLRRV